MSCTCKALSDRRASSALLGARLRARPRRINSARATISRRCFRQLPATSQTLPRQFPDSFKAVSESLKVASRQPQTAPLRSRLLLASVHVQGKTHTDTHTCTCTCTCTCARAPLYVHVHKCTCARACTGTRARRGARARVHCPVCPRTQAYRPPRRDRRTRH